MASQNLYTPGSKVRRKCKRKGRSHVQAVFTLRLHCPSLHVWIGRRANQCVNARALGLAFPFVLRKVCASLRCNFRCVCAEAGTDYWHYFTFNLHVSFIKKKATRSFFLFKYLKHDSDIQICRPFSDGFDISAPTDDAIETWITNKHMKQRKSVLTKSCLSEKKEKLFLKANAWICSDIYLRGYNYWHLFIKMTSSTYLNKN